MLKLTDIRKDYVTGDSTVHALKGVSLEFRKSEFVSILGQSGCGKTTLLNIIGGLDQYTSGDLIINGKSTKEFKDRDWDTYRNHSVGFIFQSYNLIPHQTVLANVELALTLSGVSKEERRKRATDALITVGLGEQIKKKPNQLSGGQMQRVAIARALVNDPDILLADEPTGALDSETSVQIMELLKSISNEKLIVMVTHNPDLAKEYSTRIINLLDGNVVSDSDPYTYIPEEVKENVEEDTKEENFDPSDKEAVKARKKAERQAKREAKKEDKKTSMSFFTALSLSLNNLMTKKGRTFLTSFAGSIGIIGIALILSVSAGVNAYINSVEESTMSSYPIEIQESTMDTMSMLSTLMEDKGIENPEPNTVYSNNIMASIMDSFTSGITTNNLTAFKNFIDKNSTFKDNTTDIKYLYSANLNTYKIQGKTYFETLDGIPELLMKIGLGDMFGLNENSAASSMLGGGAFKELVGDTEYISGQYDKLYGRYPTKANEVVLIVDEKQQVSDYILYTLGILDTQELVNYIQAAMRGEKYTISGEDEFTYEKICGYKFKVLPDSEKYKLDENGRIVERTQQEINNYLDTAYTLEIVGIVTPNENSASTSVIGSIGYTSALMTEIINQSNANELITAQKNNTTIDLTTGLPFVVDMPDLERVKADLAPISMELGMDISKMTDAQLISALKSFISSEPKLSPLLSMQKEGSVGLAPWGGYTVNDVPSILQVIDSLRVDGVSEENQDPVYTIAIALYYSTTLDYPDGSNFVKLINSMLTDNINYTPEQAHANTMSKLGYVDFNKPTSILIYPKDFDAKQVIKDEITKYNESQSKENKITYTDTVALLMSSVTTIIDAITYVLVAFVAISLIVSSIMIGIITYISVLERTKEIGILRAIGASKRDVSRVFNAETLIVGFAAGVIGIVVSLFFILIINIILMSLTGLETLRATLPVGAAVILVVISMVLTLVAGLFPARMASKKDPVIALRTE